MNLRRLIIADEIAAGVTPPGVVLVYALKRAGIRVKVFLCARAEADMRLLKFLLEDHVVILDTYSSGTVKNLKTLFQKSADPEAVNVVLVSLGERVEENYIQIRSEVFDLIKALSCGVVIAPYASASAILTVNAVASVLEGFEASPAKDAVLGTIFASIKNPREYQLLEQEYGRKTHILSLGYIPKDIERPMPALQDLYGPSASTRVMQIKSAALQLSSATNQVDWNILEAFASLSQEWARVEEPRYPPKNLKLAIVGDRQLSLEGGGSRVLFKTLGCDVIDYDPWEDEFPADAEAVYFPHSMSAFYAGRLLSIESFVRGIKQCFASNKLIFANGASALIFGQNFISPSREKIEALGFFSFNCSISSMKPDAAFPRVEIRGTADSIFTKADEKLRGYALDYFHVNNPGNVVTPMWGYRDIRKGAELGVSGWVKAYCFVTDLCVDLWSNPEVVNRWLSLRKH